MDFEIFLSIILGILFLWFLILKLRSSHQLKKLRRNYNKNENKSRRVGLGREDASSQRRVERISEPSGYSTGDEKPRRRKLFQNSTYSDSKGDGLQDGKINPSRRKHRLRRRRRRKK